MINTKIIYRILGSLLFIEALLMLFCLGISIFCREDDLPAFIIAIAISAILGLVLKSLGRNADNHMGRRDGYVVVSISWVLFSLIGMLPYVISGYIPSVTDAFFETVSGFTTTGASILNNIESFPHGLLFWRSLTQWIGGLGIVFFTIAILPTLGLGDVKLFAAEATGPIHEKLHPRISVTAKWLWTVYLTLTLACAGALFLEGMSVFDSVCHALTCTSTGGYSTRQSSVAAFHSSSIEYTLTGFMFFSGANFSLLYFLLKGKVSKLFSDTEFRGYLAIVLVATTIVTFSLVYQSGRGWEEAFRHAIFQVVSIQTTTGYITDDYMLWPPALLPIILMLMALGASSGSTTGGLKCVRAVMLVKFIGNEFRRVLHPNAVLPVRISHMVVSNSLKTTLLAFFSLYVSIIFFSWILLMFMGIGFMESVSVTFSSLGNVGPGMGTFGPTSSWSALPAAAKWYSSFLMIVGRLEMFSVLLLFYPKFWKER